SDAAQNELVVAAQRAILYAAEKSVRRTVAIAAINRALRDAVLLGHLVVANECLVADDDLLGVKLAATRIEPLLGGVHRCVIPRFRNDTPFRTETRACRRTFLSGSTVATQPSIERDPAGVLPPPGYFRLGPRDRLRDAKASEFLGSCRDFAPNGRSQL